MNFNDETAYKAYFEALATSHVDIGFFIYGDDEAIHTAQRSEANNAAGYTLWLEYYPPIKSQGERDNYLGTIKAEFTIMKATSKRVDDRASLQAASKLCEDIVQQVLAKIEFDYNEGVINNINEPQWESIQFGKMENAIKGATSYIGTLCELEFLVPLKLTYDSNKWA